MADKSKKEPPKQKKRKTDELDTVTEAAADGGKTIETATPSNNLAMTPVVTLDGTTPSTSNSKTNVSENTEGRLKYISDFNVPAFRILRKLVKAGTRAKHNHDTLKKALDENRLPRGLCPKKIPLNIPDMQIKHQLEWEKAHSDLNRTLTEILKNHWQERYILLERQYQETLKPIEDRGNKKETAHITALLKKSEDETIEALKERDEKKKIQKEPGVEEEEKTPSEKQ